MQTNAAMAIDFSLITSLAPRQPMLGSFSTSLATIRLTSHFNQTLISFQSTLFETCFLIQIRSRYIEFQLSPFCAAFCICAHSRPVGRSSLTPSAAIAHSGPLAVVCNVILFSSLNSLSGHRTPYQVFFGLARYLTFNCCDCPFGSSDSCLFLSVFGYGQPLCSVVNNA